MRLRISSLLIVVLAVLAIWFFTQNARADDALATTIPLPHCASIVKPGDLAIDANLEAEMIFLIVIQLTGQSGNAATRQLDLIHAGECTAGNGLNYLILRLQKLPFII